jgi:tRNA uridine 5-carbamoylmethylation protein Kti12
MLLVLGGLSGAGKTTLAQHLEKQCTFCWFELDPPEDNEAVTEFKRSYQWKEFLSGNPSPLIERFPGNTVITVSSDVIIDSPNYLTSSEIRIRYLSGPQEQCFSRAHERSPNIVTKARWDEYNRRLLEYLYSGKCPAEWKIEVFDNCGRELTVDELARAII